MAEWTHGIEDDLPYDQDNLPGMRVKLPGMG